MSTVATLLAFHVLLLNIYPSIQRCDHVNKAKQRHLNWPCQVYLSLTSHYKHRCGEWVESYGEPFTNTALNAHHKRSNSSFSYVNCDTLYIMQSMHAEGLGSTLATKINLYEVAMHLGIEHRIIHTPLALSGHDQDEANKQNKVDGAEGDSANHLSLEKLFLFTHSEFCIEELQKKCDYKLNVLDYTDYQKSSNDSRVTSGIIILKEAKYSLSCKPIKKYLYHQYQYARRFFPIDTPFSLADKSILNAVIHIRRGDEFRSARLIDESMFASIATLLLEEFHRMKDVLKSQGVLDIRFHVFSEGESKDFPLFSKDVSLKDHTTLHLNEDLFTAFHSMTKADIFVSLSHSAFSSTAALLRDKGLTIGVSKSCFTHQHIPLDVKRVHTLSNINSTISIPLRTYYSKI